MTKTILLIAAMALGSAAYARDASCTARSTEKKLAGAAKSAFLKKCEKDASTVCETNATEKKLFGAAKSSFNKKCVKDAVG